MLSKLREYLTEGISLERDKIIGLYAPGIALSTWMYLFVLDRLLSDFVSSISNQTRTPYVGLLLSLMGSSIVVGKVLDQTGKGLKVTYGGLAACGAVSLLTLFIRSSEIVFFYMVVAGSVFAIAFTGLRVYLVNLTNIEERGRITGGLLFLSYIFITLSKLATSKLGFENAVLLVSLICFAGTLGYLKASKKEPARKKVAVYGRSVHYFMLSWLLFVLAYGVWNSPAIYPHPTAELLKMDPFKVNVIRNIGAGLFALAGGVAADWFGRRIVMGFGFGSLGIAYLFYGLFQRFGYMALLLETLSWGIIYAIFVFVIWGDIIKNNKGLFFGSTFSMFFGGMLLGALIAQHLGPIPSNIIAVITFLLLVIGILPLNYADEPLPKEKVKTREMAAYMKKIKGMGK